jgi:hypothetical protein
LAAIGFGLTRKSCAIGAGVDRIAP